MMLKRVMLLMAFSLSCLAGVFGLNWEGMKAVKEADGSVMLADSDMKGGPYLICFPIPVNPAKGWEMSVDARCEKVTGRVQVYIRVLDVSGKVLKYFNSNSISGTKDWQTLSVQIPPESWPEGTVSLRILMQPAAGAAEGTGKAWFRNFTQGEIEPAIEETAKMAETDMISTSAPWGLKWVGSKYQIEDGAILVNDDTPLGGNYVISEQIPVDCTKSWQLSVEAKCQIVSGRTQVYVRACDVDDKRLHDWGTDSLTKSSDWTKLRLEVPADKWPEGTKCVRVILQPAAGPAEGIAKAWFRNLTYGEIENVQPIQGLECTKEFVFKYGQLTLLNNELHKFPFEKEPEQARIEIMRNSPAYVSAIQILADEKLGGTINVSPWIEGEEKYDELKPMALKKVPRGYLLDVTALPAWRKLALVFPGKKDFTIDDLQVSRVIFPEENWSASWIWFTTDRVEMIEVFLRKEFELKEAPTRAMWQCAFDDGGIVYFNGKRHGAVDGRFSPPNDDVARYLKPGKNVIAVEVHQGRYAAGFLGELDMNFADGTHQKLVTDKSWKFMPSDADIRRQAAGAPGVKPPSNWMDASFDSSNLGECVELGIPPGGAWGAVRYRMNAPRLPITLVTPAYPAVLQAGVEYSQEVFFKADVPCKVDTPVYLQMSRNNTTFHEWEIGIAPTGKKEFSLSYKFGLSPFICPGEYQMKIVMSGYVASNADGTPCDIQKVRVNNSRTAETPDARIKRDPHGVPTLMINGQPYPSIFSARGVRQLTQHAAQFNSAHLHLYHVYHTPNWPAPGQHNFAQMDAIAENILSGDPKALFIVKLQLRDGKPIWYLPKYPEDAVEFDNGAKANHISLASWRWKEMVGEYLRDFIRHIADSPYADHVIGYFPDEGEEGQWMHYWSGGNPASPGTLSDYSPAMLDYFRQWLKKNYASEEALRKAWGEPEVTFETATIPTREERIDGEMGLRSLPRNRKAADFGWALGDVVSEGIEYYAKIVKEVSGGKALTGGLYGHLMDLGGGFLGEQVGYARQKLPVETPYIDYYLGPMSYSHRFRDVGYPGGYDMPSPGTLELHNKIWINENDLRSHLEFPAGYAYSVRTPALFSQQLAREFVKALCGRAGYYYYPLGESGMGWFDDPETIDTIRELSSLGEATITGDRRSVSEIAAFFDDDAQCRLRQTAGREVTSLNGNAIMQREALFRIGAPVDEFLQFDISNPKLRSYKFYVFLNPYFLKEDQIAAIQKIAERPGVNILFIFTPGVATDNGLDTKVATLLTGMKFEFEKAPRAPQFKTAKSFGLLKAGSNFGLETNPYGPVAIPSGYDEVLATFAGDDAPAVVRKGNIYVATLGVLPVEMLRDIAKQAQVFTYSEDNIAVYACRQYAGFHSSNNTKNCVFRAPQGKLLKQLWPVGSKDHPVEEFRWANTGPRTVFFEILDKSKKVD
ncbi:MAG: hypothetical protein GX946_12505 [Oligosphaeraceae bacterium]|nr:hypothetical protein [Oligosphaeraceae bacterium]